MNVSDAFSNMQQFRDAIASIESRGSGDYAALGPVTSSGDRAYGRYQVMGANVPRWTKQALGTSLTPEQFLASPRAQDQVFDSTFGGYLKNHDPRNAASIWFTGRPIAQGAGAHDITGTSGSDYVSRFDRALGKAAGSPLVEQLGGGQPHLPVQGGGAPQPPIQQAPQQSPFADVLADIAVALARPRVAQSPDGANAFGTPQIGSLLYGTHPSLALT